jgi:hypothetical protein
MPATTGKLPVSETRRIAACSVEQAVTVLTPDLAHRTSDCVRRQCANRYADKPADSDSGTDRDARCGHASDRAHRRSVSDACGDRHGPTPHHRGTGLRDARADGINARSAGPRAGYVRGRAE